MPSDISSTFPGINDRWDDRKRAYPDPGQQDRQTRGHQRGEAEGIVWIVWTDNRQGEWTYNVSVRTVRFTTCWVSDRKDYSSVM